jgi:hypothetical protein
MPPQQIARYVPGGRLLTLAVIAVAKVEVELLELAVAPVKKFASPWDT